MGAGGDIIKEVQQPLLMRESGLSAMYRSPSAKECVTFQHPRSALSVSREEFRNSHHVCHRSNFLWNGCRMAWEMI